ncbi:hypothetical protein ACFYQ5_20715 [Streptomyces sp. NPDC005794]|uniref:hypothetical protein n=1 Tax=Streptomyces sp. NPDC005794 TaxID=3364733 RepID=UPI0036927550
MLTEVAAPVTGLLPLTREVVVRAWIAAERLQKTAPSEEPDPIARLGDTARSMSQAAHVILHARNHAARTAQTPASSPASPTRPSASRRR